MSGLNLLGTFSSHQTWANAWEVLMLFVIPIGGGIPAGVILAQAKGFHWAEMTVLYFISDLMLACVFEPLMLLMIYVGKKHPVVAKVNEAFRASMKRTVSQYGLNPNPFMLVVISFGVDPMTGRVAAKAAGHRFFSGWAIAIVGDLFFFLLIMASTLWLNSYLGDGTLTAVIIMVGMMVVPGIVRKIKAKFGKVEI